MLDILHQSSIMGVEMSQIVSSIDLPIYLKKIAHDVIPTVGLSRIHALLGCKQQVLVWIRETLDKYGFREDEEYAVDYFLTASRRASLIEYFVPIDVAITIVNDMRTPIGVSIAPIEVYSYLTMIASIKVNQEQKRNDYLFGKRLRHALRGIYLGKILTQCLIEGYRIDFYIPDYLLAIEIYDGSPLRPLERNVLASSGSTSLVIANSKRLQSRLEHRRGISFIQVVEGQRDVGIKQILDFLRNKL